MTPLVIYLLALHFLFGLAVGIIATGVTFLRPMLEPDGDRS